MKFPETIIGLSLLLSALLSEAQHPDMHLIDSLEHMVTILPEGPQRIGSQLYISREYAWPMIPADTVAYWAGLASRGATALAYPKSIAEAQMLLGVADLFRRRYTSAKINLLFSCKELQRQKNDLSLGWCKLWLAESAYGQDEFEIALDIARESAFYLSGIADREGQGKIWTRLAKIFRMLGETDSSAFYSKKGYALREVMSDRSCVLFNDINLGQISAAEDDYGGAMNYFNQVLRYAKESNIRNCFNDRIYYDVTNVINRIFENPGLADYYFENLVLADSTWEMSRVSYGEGLLRRGEYYAALRVFQTPIERFRSENDCWNLMRVLYDASKAQFNTAEKRLALPLASEAYTIAKTRRDMPFVIQISALLSSIYTKLTVDDSAMFFSRQYTGLKDSLIRNYARWSAVKKQEDLDKQSEQMAFLKAEGMVKQQNLDRDNALMWAWAAAFTVAMLLGFILIKNLRLKRRNENLENTRRAADLLRSVSDLEMQTLRAQMNPHFIFNCLNSINSFILRNENNLASVYLTRFSRLLRMVLNNSQKSFINIGVEVEMLTLYLEMEKLRFKDSFNYQIHYMNDFDLDNVFVPALIMQPFAENAIWHGLLHNDGPGKLLIEIKEEEGILNCVITDNGIGRARSAQLQSKSQDKKKSMGLRIAAQRLALLKSDASNFEIRDCLDEWGYVCGTKVILKILYLTFDDRRVKDIAN